MQGVSRKPSENFENMMRRFNRKVQQSGVLTEVKKRAHFEKPLSKTEQREIAIRKRVRKDAKTKSMLLKGL
jgi:small subunit ribosomal protein S21